MRNSAVRRCLILLPILASAATLAKSNGPSPSPPEIRKPEQSKPGEPEAPAQKNQDRTAIPPLVIKEAPAQKAQKEPTENTKEADSKTSTDWWMVWLTGILAFVASLQLIVFGLQARRLRQTIETMKKIGADQSKDMQGWIAVADKSADAAKRSADSDRPHMLPAQFKISGMRGPVGDDGKIKSICEFRFINYGRSPAFMKTFCFQDHIGHELPPIPTYGESIKISHIIAVNGWLGSVEGEVSAPIGISMPASDAADILVGRNNYFIFGYIEYEDVASQNHKMRFAYSFDWGQGDMSERFRPAGPDTYREYT